MAGETGKSESQENQMAETIDPQPGQEQVLGEILKHLKTLSDLTGPRGLPGLQGIPGPACSSIACEARLTRIETKLTDFIETVQAERVINTKKFEDHDSELKGIRRGLWLGAGGLGVLSFLSPALIKIFFHL
jgi:hypothetical protein